MIHTGVKTRKGVVGYDLTHLLVGSEGTLGVITGLTLKLIPHPSAVTGVAAVFKSLQTAMQTVTKIMVHGHLPSAIEFMDHKCLAIVGDLLPFAVPGEKASLLIIETDGDTRQIENEIEIIGRLCTESGATHLLPAPDESEREHIWEVRRQVSRRIQDNANLYVPEDVAVPINRIAELVDALPELEEKYGLEIYTFGHAGDGNIHISLSIQNLENIERVEKCVEAIYTLVLKMNGTISGEHGIGIAKKKFLSMELSAESIRLQQGIKKLFDPNLILNPGKIFPDEFLFI
jgi:D-lactate dehydrogenase (cytochrome)